MLWHSVLNITLVSKCTLHPQDFALARTKELLGETNLLGSVSKLPPFVTQIVLGFYVNLSKDIGDPASLNFQKTLVR